MAEIGVCSECRLHTYLIDGVLCSTCDLEGDVEDSGELL